MMVKKIMQLPVCAPRVDGWMLKSEYWIKKTVNADQIILNADQIMRLNEKTFQKVKSKGFEEWLYHLENYPDAVSRSDLLNIMKAHSSKETFPSKTYYDIHGQKIPEASRREILKQVNLEKINEENPVKWGMLIKREDVRAFPTDMVFAEKPEEFDFDLFQLTILPAASPVAILHHSHDSQWVYVQSRICKGWLKAESVALVKDKKDIFDYLHSEHFLIITESRVETEPNPFVSEISNILFQMGDRIPLIDFDEIPESIPLHCRHAQSPQARHSPCPLDAHASPRPLRSHRPSSIDGLAN